LELLNGIGAEGREILASQPRDIVVLNAAAAIDSGAARELLARLLEQTSGR